ncbi:hypothetical protein ACO2Q8_03020 [Larkinella sp. VNQ87]|uniref:hypothetical protein n=1 Tax=Larkinella sp. VNQ87 TaxID=3400921 RepID=UPI003C0E4665
MQRRTRLLKLTACLLVLWQGSPAQDFQFRAEVPAVPQPGYYRILLLPSVLGRLNAAQTDLRLYDDKNREIPYLLTKNQPVQQTQFKAYELIGKTITPRVATTLVLRNPAKSPIHSLGLVIKNTNVRKKARLSGSNDAKTWYGIEDEYELEPVASSATTSEAKILDFPLSDYEYYQLEINDSLSAPLNILQVGYYTATARAGQYAEISGVSFAQRDSSNRKSYVHIRFPTLARPDKLMISVKAPSQYRRSAELAQRRVRKRKRAVSSPFFETVQGFELNSKDSLHPVYVSDLQTRDLYLIIENQDNAPLALETVKAYQAVTYALAELKPDQAYHLSFANPSVGRPVYDLVYFKDKIPANLPIVQVREPVATPTAGVAPPSFFTNRWLIWGALGVVIVLLSFLSYRMVNEMKSR